MEHAEALAEARNKDPQTLKREQSHPSDLHVRQNQARSASEENSDSDGDNHIDRLAQVRKSGLGESIKTAKDLAEVASPMGALSLLKQVHFFADMPYVAAMGAALLKDLLDIVTFETIVLPIVFSALCTIFIFMMMLLAGSGGRKKAANSILKKGALLVGGGVADAIPGIDFFPIETITVMMVYVMELIERKNAAK